MYVGEKPSSSTVCLGDATLESSHDEDDDDFVSLPVTPCQLLTHNLIGCEISSDCSSTRGGTSMIFL